MEERKNHRDSRGPGYSGLPLRGNSVTPPLFWESRSELMWTPPPARFELTASDQSLVVTLKERFGEQVQQVSPTSDMPTFKVVSAGLKDILRFLKHDAQPKFGRLDDLTAIDETARREKGNYPEYTLVYHLLSYENTARIRLKVELSGQEPEAESITDVWPSANWYEREVYDMFGIRFQGHPRLRRILMPYDWEGHPLRKSYPGRATAMPPYTQDDARKYQPLDAGIYLKQPEGEEELLLETLAHTTSARTVCCALSSNCMAKKLTTLIWISATTTEPRKKSESASPGTS